MSEQTSRMIIGLLEGSHTLAPDDLPVLVRRQADVAGLHDTWIYVVDVQQHVLTPLPVPLGPKPPPAMAVDASIAGRAFWSQRILDVAADGSARKQRWLWVPIVDGTERRRQGRAGVRRVNGPAGGSHRPGVVVLRDSDADAR